MLAQILFADSIASRLVVCTVCIVVGIVMIASGVHSVRTRRAEESGKRRLVNQMLGRSNTYEGNTAVFIGYLRIILGVAAIIFGVVFIFVGPFLAN